MRELISTGFRANMVRHIVASYLFNYLGMTSGWERMEGFCFSQEQPITRNELHCLQCNRHCRMSFLRYIVMARWQLQVNC